MWLEPQDLNQIFATFQEDYEEMTMQIERSRSRHIMAVLSWVVFWGSFSFVVIQGSALSTGTRRCACIPWHVHIQLLWNLETVCRSDESEWVCHYLCVSMIVTCSRECRQGKSECQKNTIKPLVKMKVLIATPWPYKQTISESISKTQSVIIKASKTTKRPLSTLVRFKTHSWWFLTNK
jgi:hypothetical protein